MHTIIYLTGTQGSGKSLLSQNLVKSQEIILNEKYLAYLDEIILEVEKQKSFACTMVITHQTDHPSAFVDGFLESYAGKNNLTYHQIHLKKRT